MAAYLHERVAGIWRQFQRLNRYQIALLVIIILNIAVQRLWIARNLGPPELDDDADHLWTSLLLYQTLYQHGLLDFVKQFLHSVSHIFHPPLIPALTALFYLCFGQSVSAALWINALFIGLFYGYLFKLIKRMAGEWPAVLTVSITALFPLTYGLARLYLLEFGLATLVLMWLYYFYQSDGLNKKGYLLGLGLLLGAGLLAKVTFVMCIAGPILWAILQKARWGGKTVLLSMGRIVLMSGLGGLLALPWYWKNIDFVWAGVRAVSSEQGQPSGVGPRLAWSTLMSFGTEFLQEGISVYFFLLGLVLLGIALVTRRLSGRALTFLFAWWMPPFLICTLAAEKILRYLFPVLPALAALIALALASLLPASPRRRAFVLTALLAIPVGNFLQLSFIDTWTRLPEAIKTIVAHAPLGVLDMASGYQLTYRPRSEEFPTESLLQVLQTHTSARVSQAIRGVVYSYWHFLRGDPDPCGGYWFPLKSENLMFLGRTRNIPIEMVYGMCAGESLDRCAEEQADSEFLIIERPSGFTGLEEALAAGLIPFQEIATIALPRSIGTEAVICQRNPQPVP